MSKMPKVGDVVGIRKLRNAYGTKCPHLVSILGDALKSVPRESRKDRRKWTVVAELPDPEDYPAMRAKRFTTTVGDLIESAYSQAESVGEELRNWHDNLPEGLQMAEKGEMVGEAADTVENTVCEKPDDLPERIAELSVVYVPGTGTSRQAQLSEAADMLRTALGELPSDDESDGIDVNLEDVRGSLDSAADELETSARDDLTALAGKVRAILDELPEEEEEDSDFDLDELRSTLDSAADELEGVECPGMY